MVMKESSETLQVLQSIGLSEQKANETMKNAALTKHLLSLVEMAKNQGGDLGRVGMLLYHLATTFKSQIHKHFPMLVKYIIEGKITNIIQINAAQTFLLAHGNEDFKVNDFETASGVGIVITADDIESAVSKAIQDVEAELREQRYNFNFGSIFQTVRQKLKWADGKMIKREVDIQILSLLGPKTQADYLGSEPQPAAPKSKVSEPLSIIKLFQTKNFFHKPGENYTSDGYVVTPNTMSLMKEHLQVTGGQVRTRFPPEPNGVLHIGHAKAININFGYAKAFGGICFLRYDDTNPEKEDQKFVDNIKDMVEWLGYKPYKITYSSDYFPQLYELAIKLIKKGLAYVCHMKPHELKGHEVPESKWRNRSIEENLQAFQDMKNGKFAEGEATLRMKHTLEEGKQDPVAYRIKYFPHHRTGTTWCIYPTYDYTHCLCDSLENITHSLCTKEFQSRRSSYYWLCNALDVYCPVQWEYGRLNLNYTVVSKRKIQKLIQEKVVRGWDDPRLFTLTALRRRGFPKEAINMFCAEMGVTGAQAMVDPTKVEAVVRDVLNDTAPRAMVVMDPLLVTIVNFPNDAPKEVEIPNFPNKPEKGHHKVPFGSKLYIDRSDFKEVTSANEDFRRLTTTQAVGLRQAPYIILVKKVKKNELGSVVEVEVTCERTTQENKPKAFIQWVAEPVNVELRMYDRLFKHKNPEDINEVPGGFLSDISESSLEIKRGYGDVSLKQSKVYDKYQFERIGFFSVDPDTKPYNLVFNLTVSLKEDVGKSGESTKKGKEKNVKQKSNK